MASFKQEFKGYPSVFLHTGDCFVGVQPTLVTLVLGSCVAVTMYCPTKQITAICHAFLPDSTKGREGHEPQPCRFVDVALQSMLSTLNRLGADLDELEVKVMGGASGLSGLPSGGSRFNMAARNVEMADKVLAANSVKVKARDVGGNRGRKLHVLSHSGEIWIKRLSRMASAEAAAREGRGYR